MLLRHLHVQTLTEIGIDWGRDLHISLNVLHNWIGIGTLPLYSYTPLVSFAPDWGHFISRKREKKMMLNTVLTVSSISSTGEKPYMAFIFCRRIWGDWIWSVYTCCCMLSGSMLRIQVANSQFFVANLAASTVSFKSGTPCSNTLCASMYSASQIMACCHSVKFSLPASLNPWPYQ